MKVYFKMRKFLVICVMVIFSLICMTSCDPVSQFRCSLRITNNTVSEIYVKYKLSEETNQITTYAPQDTWRVILGEIDQENREEYPPESYISERLEYIEIYRKNSDSVQLLPKHFYDEAGDFILLNDYFMNLCETFYCIEVTEEMFSE